jgi:PAS domain S-box-containing protein
MLNYLASSAARRLRAVVNSQASIEFDIDGTIRDANRLFLDLMGYSLAELRGPECVNDFATPGVMNLLCRAAEIRGSGSPSVAG